MATPLVTRGHLQKTESNFDWKMDNSFKVLKLKNKKILTVYTVLQYMQQSFQYLVHYITNGFIKSL